MQNKTFSRMHRLGLGALLPVGLTTACLLTTGCGVNLTELSAPIKVAGSAMKGQVYGGQQPIAGAAVQLYAASTLGYGAGSYALLNTPVTTDANGNFSITGDYTCPSSSSLVYLTSTGGNPGAGTNSAIALMAALGACGNLSSSTFVTINEVTTVASVYALAPFMTGYANVGTSATNVQGLTNAFASVNKLASIASGQSAQATLPAGATGPVAAVNTIANIVASCVNTVGASSSQCSTLFSNAVSSTGAQPTDTVGATLNIARSPGQNVSALFALNSSTAPFQPAMTSANDFTLTIKYKPGGVGPSAAAIAANGDVWVTNSVRNTITVLNAGTGAATTYSGGGLGGPSGIAFDRSGNAWVTNQQASSISVFTPAGVGTNAGNPSSLLSQPSSIAIDASDNLWITNSGSNTVSELVLNGTQVSTASAYSAGGVNKPVAVAINPY